MPTVPAVVTWQAAQSEPGGIAIPIGDIAEPGEAAGDGEDDGVGDGAPARNAGSPPRSGSATITRNPDTTRMPVSRAPIARPYP